MKGSDVCDWIRYNADRTPQKVAIQEYELARRLSYQEFDKRIDACASYLQQELRVQLGDRVCVYARNCIEVFEIQFACARIGAIFIPVNWRLAAPELEFIITDAEPAVILHETEFQETAQTIAATCGQVSLVAFAAGAPTGYEQGITRYSGRNPEKVPVDLEDIWIILYTSGTTGRPKGAQLSHRMMLFNVLNFVGPSRLGSDNIFLCAMPTFHTGGLNCYANPLFHLGGTVILMHEFNPAAALTLMADPEVGITHFFATSSHYLMISQVEGFKDATFPTLRIAGMGGAPSTKHLQRTWVEKGVPLQPAYGMTEIGPAILITEESRVSEKLGSAGQPVLHCEIKVMGPNGEPVPAGERGEMWVRGPVHMTGYWRREEATQESFVDGWFRTGDVVWRDEEGYVYIVDRLKDMFISGGENVYPVEVENIICEAPGIIAAAVVGVPHDRWGEVGRAFVVPEAGHTPDRAALAEHCRKYLAKYKIPQEFVMVDDLPRNPSGKVLKRELRKINSTQ